MIRGTTPTHIFTLPFNKSLVKRIRVIYAQGGKTIVKKDTDQCKLEGSTVTVKLTQEETLSFSKGSVVDIQLRVLTTGGDALASEIYHKYLGQLLENEVLE